MTQTSDEVLPVSSEVNRSQRAYWDAEVTGVDNAEKLEFMRSLGATTRSVLIYVEDKRRALEEFFRVLRPGGRISLFEPINRRSNFFETYDVGPVQALFDRVRAIFDRIQPPDEDPMLNFDEHDLVVLAEGAGFREVYLRLEFESKPPRPCPWETFLTAVGNPKIPSFGEAMEQAPTSDERARLIAHLRPLVEQGRGRLRMASAYLWAVKEPLPVGE